MKAARCRLLGRSCRQRYRRCKGCFFRGRRRLGRPALCHHRGFLGRRVAGVRRRVSMELWTGVQSGNHNGTVRIANQPHHDRRCQAHCSLSLVDRRYGDSDWGDHPAGVGARICTYGRQLRAGRQTCSRHAAHRLARCRLWLECQHLPQHAGRDRLRDRDFGALPSLRAPGRGRLVSLRRARAVGGVELCGQRSFGNPVGCPAGDDGAGRLGNRARMVAAQAPRKDWQSGVVGSNQSGAHRWSTFSKARSGRT